MSHVIAAVSTGASVSAIGIIRLSGDGCIAAADKVFTLNSGKSLGIPRPPSGSRNPLRQAAPGH